MDYEGAPIRLLSITRKTDLAEYASRVYPRGNDVSLIYTTRTASGEYTLDATAGYIANGTAEALYGRRDSVQYFDISLPDSTGSESEQRVYGANALYDAALEWLGQHDSVATFYSIVVTGYDAPPKPGETIHVLTTTTVDGADVIEIDDDFNIVEASYGIDADGLPIATLEITDIERRAVNGERLLANAIVSAGRKSSGTGSTVTILGQLIHDNLAGISADNHHAPVTLGAGSAGELSLNGQELTLAAVLTPTEHTAIGNGSPHHAPATAGTGISLSGQQVGINLAADLTWTGNQTFQGQNSHRHILPEATDTYDIGSATRLWRAGYLSTLYSIIFAESTIQLIGGSFMIPKSTGKLPAVGSGDTIINFGQAMTIGDHLLIKGYDAGGALKTEYMRIEEAEGGTTYRVTRDEAGGDDAPDPAWADGTPYAVLGQAGNGRIELDAVTSPRISILTQGAAYNSQTEVYRVGDLNGNWGYSATTYGLGLGEYATGKANLTYDPSNGLRLRIYNTDYIQLDTAGNALITNKLQLKGASSALAIGSTPPTSASAGTGVWLDRTGLYALTTNAARTVVNAGGLRVARDSTGLRFVSSSNILTDTDATDGRIFHQSSDGALVIKAPSGYLNIDVGTAALRANIGGTPAFWKLLSKGSSNPGDTDGNVQLAFGTSSNNYVMLEQASGKPLLNLYLGTGSSPQRQGGFYYQYTNPTYVPLYRMVSLNVAASGGTGYIGTQDYGDGTYIQFAHVMLVGFKVADGKSQMWCYGSLYKPGSDYNAIYFTTDRGALSATSGEHFVYLNSSGQLAIRNNSGSAFHYIGWAVTTQK